ESPGLIYFENYCRLSQGELSSEAYDIRSADALITSAWASSSAAAYAGLVIPSAMSSVSLGPSH
ncbi:uncharacterized protein METZ01_LOCUS480983, partial [marine metagenome]